MGRAFGDNRGVARPPNKAGHSDSRRRGGKSRWKLPNGFDVLREVPLRPSGRACLTVLLRRVMARQQILV